MLRRRVKKWKRMPESEPSGSRSSVQGSMSSMGSRVESSAPAAEFTCSADTKQRLLHIQSKGGGNPSVGDEKKTRPPLDFRGMTAGNKVWLTVEESQKKFREHILLQRERDDISSSQPWGKSASFFFFFFRTNVSTAGSQPPRKRRSSSISGKDSKDTHKDWEHDGRGNNRRGANSSSDWAP